MLNIIPVVLLFAVIVHAGPFVVPAPKIRALDYDLAEATILGIFRAFRCAGDGESTLPWCNLLLTTPPLHRTSVGQAMLIKKFGTRLLLKQPGQSYCSIFGEAAASAMRTLTAYKYDITSMWYEVSQKMPRKLMVDRFTALCKAAAPPELSLEDISAIRLVIRLDALLPMTNSV
jgi:hypothetical protein